MTLKEQSRAYLLSIILFRILRRVNPFRDQNNVFEWGYTRVCVCVVVAVVMMGG